jgi:N-methylhydantoinase A
MYHYLLGPGRVRPRLPRGASFQGPAILEQMDSTTVVDPGVHGAVDAAGNLILTVG